jgi:hypothetical protein
MRRWSPAVLALATWGCGGISPFGALNFANQNTTTPPPAQHQIGQPSDGPPQAVVNSTCDLSADRKIVTMMVRNEAPHDVAYVMTLLASAGAGGFVCDADRPSYLAAGYLSVPLGGGGATQIGCNPVVLSQAGGFRGGTELLALTIMSTMPANLTGNPQQGPIAANPLDGSTPIPVPEVIVLGSNDAVFVCVGSDLCTQGGFSYNNALQVPIQKITATRTQGTMCNTGAAARAEWRLLNPSQADSTAQGHQYVAGGGITLSVLDRLFAAAGNQVVWRVIGPLPGLTDVHQEER